MEAETGPRIAGMVRLVAALDDARGTGPLELTAPEPVRARAFAVALRGCWAVGHTGAA